MTKRHQVLQAVCNLPGVLGIKARAQAGIGHDDRAEGNPMVHVVLAQSVRLGHAAILTPESIAGRATLRCAGQFGPYSLGTEPLAGRLQPLDQRL